MRQPSDGIRLAATRRVFNQVIWAGAVDSDIICQLFNRPKLMVAREDEGLLLGDLTRVGTLRALFLNEYEPLDEQDDFLFCPDILPHIGNIDAVLVVGVALADGVRLCRAIRSAFKTAFTASTTCEVWKT